MARWKTSRFPKSLVTNRRMRKCMTRSLPYATSVRNSAMSHYADPAAWMARYSPKLRWYLADHDKRRERAGIKPRQHKEYA